MVAAKKKKNLKKKAIKKSKNKAEVCKTPKDDSCPIC